MLPIDFEAQEIYIELLRFGFVENSQDGCRLSKCHISNPPYREITSAVGHESIYHRTFTRATALITMPRRLLTIGRDWWLRRLAAACRERLGHSRTARAIDAAFYVRRCTTLGQS